MLFDLSLRRELGRNFGATVAVLLTVVMTMMLVRTLGQAYKGSVAGSDILLIMGYTVLAQLPTILGLGLFIAVVATLSRMYRDSEMVVWFASGQSLQGFVRPLLRFAVLPLALIAALSLLALPWSQRQVEQLRSWFEQRADVDRIAPGEFQTSADGTRVFFVDRDTPQDAAASNLFVVASEATSGGPRESLTSARGARLQVQDGGRSVILERGQRLQIDRAGGADGEDGRITLSRFQEYGSQLRGGTPHLAEVREQAARSTSTRELLQRQAPIDRAELAWRIGLPLAAANLVLLGLALASVNPRAGGGASLMMALLAFIVYYNLMTLANSWVAAGRLGAAVALLGLHGGVLLLAALLVWLRQQRWSWRHARAGLLRLLRPGHSA